MFEGWSIEDFSQSIGARSLAMLTVFLDDTGTHRDSQVVGLLGMVSPMAEWARFETAWKKQLKIFGVSAFHAVDCERGNKAFQGIEKPERDALKRRLIGVMGDHGVVIVGSAVVRTAWDSLDESVKTYFKNDPIFLCFEACLQQLSQWSKDHQSGDPVAIVFSQQEQHQGQVIQLHNYYQRSPHFANIGSFSVARANCVIPLQAADFVAYESYQKVLCRLKGAQQRWEATELQKSGVANISIFHNHETLTAMVEAGPKTYGETVSASTLMNRNF